MASLFPPVEPRSLTGSGMSADPETIQDLQDTWEIRDRANRAKPRKKFHQVLKEVGGRAEKQEPAPLGNAQRTRER